MDRINKIYRNITYREHLDNINRLEQDRIYCRHDINHFLDVARIATIVDEEYDYDIPTDMIYAAALLHDIGRDIQYTEGIEHEIASSNIAPKILEYAGYNKEESDIICEAIKEHGNEAVRDRKDLTGLLYRADKLSRKCFCCKAIESCKKPEYKRNMVIKI